MSQSTSTRRKLKFNSIEELEQELDRLRSCRYSKRGNWSLPQACRHVAVIIESNLTPPESDQPTPEETAMKQKFFGMVLGEAGMPENLPIGNPALVPPVDCSEAEIDRLKAAFQTLSQYPHKCIKVGRCGPVPAGELTALHLAHAAHHLSFLEPAPEPRIGLTYTDEAAAIADVNLLRQGYIQTGNWTLPQACWHLGTILKFLMQEPEGPVAPATPQQTAMLTAILQTGKLPPKVDAPPQVLPPESAGDEAIDLFIREMTKMSTYTGAWRPHRLFGPMSTDKFRRLNLVHAAHHFSKLIPTH